MGSATTHVYVRSSGVCGFHVAGSGTHCSENNGIAFLNVFSASSPLLDEVMSRGIQCSVIWWWG